MMFALRFEILIGRLCPSCCSPEVVVDCFGLWTLLLIKHKLLVWSWPCALLVVHDPPLIHQEDVLAFTRDEVDLFAKGICVRHLAVKHDHCGPVDVLQVSLIGNLWCLSSEASVDLESIDLDFKLVDSP